MTDRKLEVWRLLDLDPEQVLVPGTRPNEELYSYPVPSDEAVELMQLYIDTALAIRRVGKKLYPLLGSEYGVLGDQGMALVIETLAPYTHLERQYARPQPRPLAEEVLSTALALLLNRRSQELGQQLREHGDEPDGASSFHVEEAVMRERQESMLDLSPGDLVRFADLMRPTLDPAMADAILISAQRHPDHPFSVVCDLSGAFAQVHHLLLDPVDQDDPAIPVEWTRTETLAQVQHALEATRTAEVAIPIFGIGGQNEPPVRL